jgi:hypothetical protein
MFICARDSTWNTPRLWPRCSNFRGTMVRAAHSLRVLGDLLQRHPESLLRGTPADPALPATGK